jgi:hypothetical protein
MPSRRTVTFSACLLAIAFVAFAGFQIGGSGSSGRDRTGSAKRARRELLREERRLSAALRRGVARAAALGGSVEAAAMMDRSPRPIVITSEPGGANRHMRMWSMSKVATMVALLRALRWGNRPGERMSAEVDSALTSAITRSENCPQRRIVLELQRLAGGIGAARNAMAAVFARAGAGARIDTEVEAPEPHCVPYLRSQTETHDPLAPALLLGTSTWRVTDAARLAHALAIDAYGSAISTRVLSLMRAPKLPSREAQVGELTAPLAWGAGVAFAGLDPAYKAGWGGSIDGNFLAGQLAVVPVGTDDHLAIAVMFHPRSQPPRDDPGITAAPAALQAVMESARSSLPDHAGDKVP